MPEDPVNDEAQQPAPPAEPQNAATTGGQPSPAQPTVDGGAAGEPLATAADGHLGKERTDVEDSDRPNEDAPAKPAAEPPGEEPARDDATGKLPATPQQVSHADKPEASAQPAADDASGKAAGAGTTDVSADEVEAAMQEMLEASGKSGADDASGETAGAEATDVSPEEVDAAMQEMLEASEKSAVGDTPGEAAGARTGEASADEVDAAVQETAGTSEQQATLPPNTVPFEAPDFSAEGSTADASQIDMLDDVELDVKIELGRTEMFIEDVLALGAGSVVELDKAAGDPVDIFVNDRLVARGEVLVLNDSFCVRINDILSPIPALEGEK